jgi:sialidase-1
MNSSVNRLILFLTCLLAAPVAQARTCPPVIERHLTIYEKRDEYCAWPAIARTAEGDIVVLYTRTEEHLGPDGQILLSRSTDNGETWQPPVVIYDTPIDDRESGVTRLHDGRLLAHYRSVLWTPTNYASLRPTAYAQPVLNKWIRHVDTAEYRSQTDLNRSWHAVSADGGHTWSAPSPGKDSIHGGLQLANGKLLVASYRDDGGHIGVYGADQVDNEWTLLATVTCPQRDIIRFGEPHILQLASGRILMMIRATAIPYNDASPRCHLWGAYSDDNGVTWSEPYETPLWGFPPHLTQLADGRVLCTYGHRRPPYGQRACLSEDGITWKKENELILRDDAPNKDLGYPVSLELEPGRVLTVYYQPNVPLGEVPEMEPPDPERIKPGIHGTIWQLPPPK